METVKENQLTVVDEKNNAVLAMYAEDIGEGLSDITASDLALPFIAVIQSNSPQLIKSSEKYIEGAEAGDFFNTATNQLYKGEQGIYVIPSAFKRAVVEWSVRENGGGYVATHDPDYLVKMQNLGGVWVDDKGRNRLLTTSTKQKTDNTLVETGYFFVVLVDDLGNPFGRAVMSFSSTQWKAARQWNTMISEAKMVLQDRVVAAPMFSQVYHSTTGSQSNSKGSWYGIKIRHSGTARNQDAYMTAKQFREFSKSAVISNEPAVIDAEPSEMAQKVL